MKTASSLMILDFDEKPIGSGGRLFMADCGVLLHPTVEQLADIAISTGIIARHLINETSRIAMLSFATHSQSTDPSTFKVRAATERARAKIASAGLNFEIDGELQLHAALNGYVAQAKNVASRVAGQANVLVFPHPDRGNIGFKLGQRIAEANAFGQIVTGLTKPAAEISRGPAPTTCSGPPWCAACRPSTGEELFPSWNRPHEFRRPQSVRSCRPCPCCRGRSTSIRRVSLSPPPA